MYKKISLALIMSLTLSAASLEAKTSNEMQDVIKGAIQDLVNDNKDFSESKDKEHFSGFLDVQNPRTTAVLCSDSRVHTHSITHSADNDLFVIRNIGNQIATTAGSVDYGVGVLKTPVLLIVGHSHCGAVKAAFDQTEGLPASIAKELSTLDVKAAPDDKEAVILNVHYQVEQAMQSYGDRVKNKDLAIVGTVYDFRNDYGLGKGRLIIVNLNGEKDPKAIEDSHYFDGLTNVSIGVKMKKK